MYFDVRMHFSIVSVLRSISWYIGRPEKLIAIRDSLSVRLRQGLPT